MHLMRYAPSCALAVEPLVENVLANATKKATSYYCVKQILSESDGNGDGGDDDGDGSEGKGCPFSHSSDLHDSLFLCKDG